MKMRVCSRCKLEKEEASNFQYRQDQNAYRTVCKKCRSDQNQELKRRRRKSDDKYYWTIRLDSVNRPNNRRSKKANLAIKEKIPPVEVKNLYELTRKCYYCNVPITKEEAELDHAIPLSRGGIHHISNIRICCHDCNQLKGTRTEREFNDFIREYITRFTRALVRAD